MVYCHLKQLRKERERHRQFRNKILPHILHKHDFV